MINKSCKIFKVGTDVILSAALSHNVTAFSIFRGPANAADSEIAFYVSPDGSDTNYGSLRSPFRTISAARDTVRKINSNMNCDITVYLRGGDYRITEPIEFDTRDYGTNGHTLSYKAYGGENPVLNGAQKVTGRKKYNGKLYSAPPDRGYIKR